MASQGVTFGDAKKAVLFGAGKNGLGVIVPALIEAGIHPIVVGRNKESVSSLKTESGDHVYWIERFGGPRNTFVQVTNFTALHWPSDSGRIIDEINQSSFVLSAVRKENLTTLGHPLAMAVEKRQSGEPIIMMQCENLKDGAEQLKRATQEELAKAWPDSDGPLENRIRFVDSIIDCIAPTSPPRPKDESRIVFRVEDETKWYADSEKVEGCRPSTIPAITWVSPIAAYTDHKLGLTNSPHAFAAWLGKANNLLYIDDVMRVEGLTRPIAAFCSIMIQSLVKKHSCFTEEQLLQHTLNTLRRFAKRLEDTVERVGFGPISRMKDRVIEPAWEIEQQDLDVVPVLVALNYGLQFTNIAKDEQRGVQEDEESARMARMLKASNFRALCGELGPQGNSNVAYLVTGAIFDAILPNSPDDNIVADTIQPVYDTLAHTILNRWDASVCRRTFSSV